MIRSVLVPLDGSTFGENALPLAASIARRAGASLQLVHVAMPLAAIYAEAMIGSDPEMEAAFEQRQRAYLAHLADRVKRYSGLTAAPVLLMGEAASTLRSYVLQEKPGLIVMTTHGRGALGRFWLGSVADDLLRHLHSPILLVRPREGEPDWNIEPVLRRILIPLDGTPLAEQILEPAQDLGSLMTAEYTLLRVIKPIPTIDAALPEGPTPNEMTARLQEQIEKLQQQLAQQARSYLGMVAERLAREDQLFHTRVIADENPSKAILNAADPEEIDCIAMATHGRRGLSRLLVGSVADKVIRRASVPVLICRPQAE